MTETIGFIGLGQMGEPIAANLLAAGHRVKVYNRTASKAAGLVAKGATLAANAAEVATPGGVVFTMVSDDAALHGLCGSHPSFVEKLGPDGLHVSLSTVSPFISRRLEENHRRLGVGYVAAPVFGRPEAAAAARLWICASGPAAAKKRAQPLLAAIGQATFDFGEDAGSANIVKLCGNFMIVAAVEAMAEAFTLAEKNGIDSGAVAEMMGKTLFACPVYQNYGKLIAEQKYEPAKFSVVLGMKDIGLVLQAAAASEMPMPLASLARDRFLALVAKGRKDLDWTAVALDIAENAGLKKAAAR